NTWKTSIQSNPVKFEPLEVSDKEHEKLLLDALEDTFRSLKINYSNWVLPLSGGYDSRSIVCFLAKLRKNIESLKTVTWGVKDSLRQKGNDAYVAVNLAKHFGLVH